jgi:hypothetical protein
MKSHRSSMENCFGKSGARSEESMGYLHAAIETIPEESRFGIVVVGV